MNDCSSRKATIVTVAAEFCIVFLKKKKKNAIKCFELLLSVWFLCGLCLHLWCDINCHYLRAKAAADACDSLLCKSCRSVTPLLSEPSRGRPSSPVGKYELGRFYSETAWTVVSACVSHVGQLCVAGSGSILWRDETDASLQQHLQIPPGSFLLNWLERHRQRNDTTRWLFKVD